MQNFIITQSGQELMAGMMAGTSSCSFTKVAVSCHDYSGGDLESLTELQDVRQEAVPSEISRTDGATVKIIAAINNARLDEGYYVRAVGLFARDSDGGEILYAVSIETDHPDYLPAFKGKTVSSITYSMNIRAGNSSRVVLEVSSAAVPTIEQVKNMRRDIDTHGGLSVYTEEGTHGIRYSGGTLSAKNPDTGEWEDVQAEGLAELNRLKADKESPEFTGEPKAPTPPQTSNDGRVATTGFVGAAVSNHDASPSAHDDMRQLISGLAARLNALADSDDTTLDQLSEIVAYIKNNKSLIDGVTTGKVSVSDIIDNLASAATNKPLSAKQGKTLKDLIDALTTTVGNKADKISGKGLSTNDFTNEEKSKLAGVAANANNYSLPLAASGTRGGVKIGYVQNGKNYPVQLSSEKMYVNVPWTDTDTTYAPATQIASGLMSADDKKRLDGMANNANNYSLPLAASGTRGGVKTGYSQNGRNYPVQLSAEKMFVNVPWTDTKVNLNGTDRELKICAENIYATFDSNGMCVHYFPSPFATMVCSVVVTALNGHAVNHLAYTGEYFQFSIGIANSSVYVKYIAVGW